jgi:PAS domain S-box-containing protein
MLPPPIPHDELARLAKLRAYEVLDTPPDPQFESLVRIASMITDVPIALISLVDADRQWFMARHGTTVTETPRDISFCGHVVAERVPLVVRDALRDHRFADNPLVTRAPHVRFYAGMPLRCSDGHILGTLCAIDTRPRELSVSQLDALGLLADQVVALLELRRTGAQLRAERRELADREAQLAIVFDGMDAGVVLQDRSGAILQHNRAATEILGLTADELRGRTSLDPRWRAHRADGTPFPGEDHPAMVTLRTSQPVSDVAMRIAWPSGEQRWLSIDARPLIAPGDAAPYAAITTFRDVTEKRELAERLAQHQRLLTTGTLAAGIGHEINNPLTYLLTNLGFALELTEQLAAEAPSDRLRELLALLEQAQEGGERVRDIVRGLRALVREQERLAPTDVNAVVHTAVKTASHELRTRATVKLELARSPIAHTDAARVAQILVALLANAAQAFRTADPSTNLITVRTSVEREIAIEVIDNGPGIAPDVLPRIFDPFFTTKPAGTGVGLGLAIAHGGATALGGDLRCETAPGRGATFRVTLPRATPEAKTARGRLLVVDDERVILASFARLFQADFDVVVHADPREALRCVQDGPAFDLVFCDLTMPYLSGMELYDEVTLRRPELAPRFVFVSGDLSRDDIRAFLARIPNERIEKPFSLQAMRQLARRYLPAP